MQDYDQLLDRFNAYLASLSYTREPLGLYRPIEYVLSLGGKRLRPVLAMMATQMFGKDPGLCLPQAAAIEMFHNFTLLHDDLMDHASLRRGHETVHLRWNENTAVLSGDAMVILSHRLMDRTPMDRISQAMDLFTMTGLEVCEGQQLDMEFETRQRVSVEEYLEMIRLKTSVLLACSLKMGGLMAGASSGDLDRLYSLGLSMGLAFQLEDDLLDVYGDPAVFGKNTGGDILSDKKTYMLIRALEKAGKGPREELDRWIGLRDPALASEKIAAVRRVYDQLDIRKDAQDKIDGYSGQALMSLEKISAPEDLKAPLCRLVSGLAHRKV